jgi:quinol monooxygenase YgiN
MVRVALFARLNAKPGKETELAKFLENALSIANREAGTTAWFALRFDQSTFGIFDAFQDETGRTAHLNGQIAQQLVAKAADLLTQTPKIERIDVLAAKLPESRAAGVSAH